MGIQDGGKVNPTDFLNQAIRPALLKLPQKMRSREAEAMILAICLQESDGLRARLQYGGGPARGYAQFELIGVRGVLEHPATKGQAEALCAILDVPVAPETVYEAVAWHDMLAVVFARLALWRLPDSLPGEAEPDKGWSQYLAAWGPGKPHPQKWAANWNQAWGLV